MRTRRRQNGFTLLEILIAAAMILSILSMVYGTYFTISRSTQAERAKLKLSQDALNVLTQLARQIRCSYADTVSNHTQTTGSISEQKKKISRSAPNFFSGHAANSNGEVLHLVTTDKFTMSQNPSEGLFEVTYRFDKSTGILYLSQENFVETNENTAAKKTWQPIAENIRSIELEFFDGKQWLQKWIFKNRKKLPNAVKINLTFTDQNDRTYRYNTVAYIYCHTDNNRKIQLEESTAAKIK